MTKVVNSSEYSENLISVGVALNEDGEPLLESNGVAVGTVKYLLERIVEYLPPNNSSKGSSR